mgnify:CR=1 FL=1
MRIVLMDGECSFCQESVQFIIKRDRGTFHFASLQSELGQNYVRKYSLEGIDSVILIENNRAFIYSDAALRIAQKLTFPWRLLAVFRLIPKRMRDKIYSWIAKNRHNLLKNHQVCRVPTEKERARFLA